MSHTVAFPGLFDKTFTLNPVAFTIFGRDIMWYGIIISFGFLLAAAYALKRAKSFGSNDDQIMNVLMVGLPAGIVGARLYYVLYKWSYYSAHPSEIYQIWEGGLAIYGGVIFAFFFAFLFARRKKYNVLGIFDVCSLGFLIGQCIGRWGNFVNAEAFGYETARAWGMSINGAAPVHPAFFYESLWNLIGFLLLHFYSKRRRFDGEIFLLYLTWYGLGRAWIEGLRSDSLYLWGSGLRVSQLVALGCVLVAGGLWVYFTKTKKYPPLRVQASIQTETEMENHGSNQD